MEDNAEAELSVAETWVFFRNRIGTSPTRTTLDWAMMSADSSGEHASGVISGGSYVSSKNIFDINITKKKDPNWDAIELEPD